MSALYQRRIKPSLESANESQAAQEVVGAHRLGGEAKCCSLRKLVISTSCTYSIGVLAGCSVQVSVISFGAAPLGGVYESTTEEQCIKAVHEAFELGTAAAVAGFT